MRQAAASPAGPAACDNDVKLLRNHLSEHALTVAARQGMLLSRRICGHDKRGTAVASWDRHAGFCGRLWGSSSRFHGSIWRHSRMFLGRFVRANSLSPTPANCSYSFHCVACHGTRHDASRRVANDLGLSRHSGSRARQTRCGRRSGNLRCRLLVWFGLRLRLELPSIQIAAAPWLATPASSVRRRGA